MGGFRESLKAPRAGLIEHTLPRDGPGTGAEEARSTTAVLPVLPPEFLVALRSALEAGVTCEQVVSFLMLAASLKKVQEEVGGDELIERACYIATVIKGDMEDIARAAAWMERIRKEEETQRRTQRKRPTAMKTKPRGPRVWTEERDEFVSQLYGDGLSQRKIAVRLRTNQKLVGASLRRTNTQIRSPGSRGDASSP